MVTDTPCSAAHLPIAAFSSVENFSYTPLTEDLPLSLVKLLQLSLAFSTNGFTMLFTTSMQEEGIVTDNNPLGPRSSDSDAKSFCLKYLNKDMYLNGVFNTLNNVQT